MATAVNTVALTKDSGLYMLMHLKAIELAVSGLNFETLSLYFRLGRTFVLCITTSACKPNIIAMTS